MATGKCRKRAARSVSMRSTEFLPQVRCAQNLVVLNAGTGDDPILVIAPDSAEANGEKPPCQFRPYGQAFAGTRVRMAVDVPGGRQRLFGITQLPAHRAPGYRNFRAYS